ncbi:MAG: hypothetical protein R3301_12190 [Saprospiraceae bacterium]|nr:hypothetical protein [Saprospiraceae bacterium]
MTIGCWLLVFGLVSGEVSAQLTTTSRQLPPGLRVGKAKMPGIRSVLPLPSPVDCQPEAVAKGWVEQLPPSYVYRVPVVQPVHYGMFCKIELKLEQVSGIAPRFRLGSVEYVDRLEGKY